MTAKCPGDTGATEWPCTVLSPEQMQASLFPREMRPGCAGLCLIPAFSGVLGSRH